MTSREKFEALRAKYLAADQAMDELRNRQGLNRADERRLDSLRAKCAKLRDRFFALLDQISPRNFRAGFPCHWIMTELSYADATTAGPMSVVPPCAYGYRPADMVQLAAEIVS